MTRFDEPIELCDVVLARPYPKITSRSHRFYVPMDVYDRDLLPGLRSEREVRSQFEVDCPRCMFFVGDARVASVTNMPLKTMRYCTQSVMAMPLEILHFSGIPCVECGAPLVFVTDDHFEHVTASKRLRTLLDDDDILIQVRLSRPLHTVVIDVTRYKKCAQPRKT